MPPAPAVTPAAFIATSKRILRSRPFLIAVALLLLYTLIGFFLMPFLVTHYVPRLAQDRLQRPARIGKVRMNPFVFTFEARDFMFSEADGAPLAGFGRLFIDFETSSLFRWAWTFKSIQLEQLQVNLVMAEDGVLNFARLATEEAEPPEPPSAPAEESRPPRMLLQAVRIADGRIDFTDRRPSVPATISLAPMTADFKGISTLPDREGPYSLAAQLGDGGTLEWTGEISLHPLRSNGELHFEGLTIASLWEFLRDQVNTAPPAGRLGLESRYALDLAGPSPQVTLDALALRISDLGLTLTGETTPFFQLKTAALGNGRFDLASRKMEIGSLAFKDGRVNLAVDAGGALNVTNLMAAPPASGTPAPHEPTTVPEDSPPFELSAPVIEIDGMAVAYRDASRVPELSAGIGKIHVGAALQAAFGAADPVVRVMGFGAQFTDVQLAADTADAVVQVHLLGVEGGEFDLAERSLRIARVGVEGGRVDLVREADGGVNLARLLAPADIGAVRREAEEDAKAGHAWQVSSQAFDLAGVKVSISDRTVKSEGTILDVDPLKVALSPVDGRSPMGVDLELAIVQGGSVAVNGSVDPAGPSVDAGIQVTGVALPPLQPYLDPLVRLLLRSGTFSTQGKLVYGVEAAKARLAYDGGFDLAGLKITEPGSEETFLGWQSLKSSTLKLRLEPNRIELAELKLAKPVGKLIIAEDRSVNVAEVFKKPETGGGSPSAEPPAKDAGGGFPLSLRKLQVEDGDVLFADLSLIPQFATRIHNLSGVVIGAASEANSRAQVDLDGQVDEYGTAKIDGEINLFNPTAFMDMGVVFRNVEMTNLTPYSGRFAGRKIDSGKLSLDLTYRIEDRQLLGDNQIIVDRLKLGERVESPDAVNLPLDLALALLQDSNGVIDIGLPVKGDLSSPEFSFGRLIGKALLNLITKVVTAPFRALGALLGEEAENLDSVAFEPGAAEIPPPEVEKLLKLAQALQKRPQLQLAVQGRFSPEQDGPALRNLHVRRALAASLEIALAPGEDPGPVDFGHPDTEDALEDMFRERFDKAAFKELEARVEAEEEAAEAAAKSAPSADGQAKKPPAKDPGRLAKALFARLVESEPLEETALRDLAQSRGLAISTQLTEGGGLTPQRLSLGAPAPVDGGDAPAAKLELKAAGKTP
jgi:hypothetical protein